MRISVSAKERRAAASGDGITGKENNAWQKVTPNGLQAESLLKIVDDVPRSKVEDIQAEITDKICKDLSWFFRLEPSGDKPVIVDVLKDQQGKLLAVLQWKFDQMRLSGHGGHGQVWKEARGTFLIREEASQRFVKDMESAVEEERVKIKERAEYHAALEVAGLDDKTICEKREACLRQAGLDWETVRKKRDALAVKSVK